MKRLWCTFGLALMLMATLPLAGCVTFSKDTHNGGEGAREGGVGVSPSSSNKGPTSGGPGGDAEHSARGNGEPGAAGPGGGAGSGGLGGVGGTTARGGASSTGTSR